MYDAIVWRSQGPEKFMYEIADYADIPVINALTTEDHPTQMLADAMTLEELWGGAGSCKGKKMAYLGAAAIEPLWYGRMCAYLGMDLYVIGPDLYDHKMLPEYIEELEGLFAKYSPQNKLVISDDLNLLEGMDVLTTEEWEYTNSSTGDDHGYDCWMHYAKELTPYRLTSDLMKYVKNPDVVVLHMLPSLHNADHKLGQQLLEEAPDQASRDLIASGFGDLRRVFSRSTLPRFSARQVTASTRLRPFWPPPLAASSRFRHCVRRLCAAHATFGGWTWKRKASSTMPGSWFWAAAC